MYKTENIQPQWWANWTQTIGKYLFLQVAAKHLWARERASAALPAQTFGEMYLFNLLNVFVLIDKCDLDKLESVFIHFAKCICLNKLLNVVVHQLINVPPNW